MSLDLQTEHDIDIERRVRIYLVTQGRPSLRTVRVSAEEGVVTLHGSVQSFYERQLSIHLAARVAGVRRIEDLIIVRLGAAA